MKRFTALSLAAVLAATMAASTAAQAQPYGPGPGPGPGYGPGPGGPPPGGWHHWHHGDHFHGRRYPVDWRRYRLPPPPPGYMWVQGNTAYLMIAVNNGFIANVIPYGR